MDELDRKIIVFLEKNSRIANVELAEKLGISEGTVRNRLERLLSEKTIRFTVETVSKVGFKAVVLIRFNPQKPTAALVKFLLLLKGIRGVKEVSGEWDVVCSVSVDSPEDYNEIIEKIRVFDGVEQTVSLIVLKSS